MRKFHGTKVLGTFAPRERMFHGTKVPRERKFSLWSFRSMERKFLDFSLPGSECSTERKFHGRESSLYGLFAPGNESAEERKGQLPLLWKANRKPHPSYTSKLQWPTNNGTGIGKMRKCGMQNVKCGMKSAECTCGMVCRMRNAESL